MEQNSSDGRRPRRADLDERVQALCRGENTTLATDFSGNGSGQGWYDDDVLLSTKVV